MKKIFILMLTLAAIRSVSAQQHHRKDNMTITIYESNQQPKNALQLIVTRSDSAQLQKNVDRTAVRKAKSKDQLAIHEALLQSIIQPYIDQGWQLVAASVEGSVYSTLGTTVNADHVYRYYLSKQR